MAGEKLTKLDINVLAALRVLKSAGEEPVDVPQIRVKMEELQPPKKLFGIPLSGPGFSQLAKTMIRLQDQGLVLGDWVNEEISGKRRRVFSLTQN